LVPIEGTALPAWLPWLPVVVHATIAFVAGNGRCDDARNAAYAAIVRGRCRHCVRRARRILAKCAPASEPQ